MDRETVKPQQVETVLVVDDDKNWCFISQIILRKAGFTKEAMTANNGLEALNLLQEMAARGEKLPELIFLDIMMPVMDGFAFLDELSEKADLDLSNTRIYMCTSSILPKDRERAFLYPVSGFITKPLSPEILADIMN